jgi:hypothetical protein
MATKEQEAPSLFTAALGGKGPITRAQQKRLRALGLEPRKQFSPEPRNKSDERQTTPLKLEEDRTMGASAEQVDRSAGLGSNSTNPALRAEHATVNMDNTMAKLFAAYERQHSTTAKAINAGYIAAGVSAGMLLSAALGNWLFRKPVPVEVMPAAVKK